MIIRNRFVDRRFNNSRRWIRRFYSIIYLLLLIDFSRTTLIIADVRTKYATGGEISVQDHSNDDPNFRFQTERRNWSTTVVEISWVLYSKNDETEWTNAVRSTKCVRSILLPNVLFISARPIGKSVGNFNFENVGSTVTVFFYDRRRPRHRRQYHKRHCEKYFVKRRNSFIHHFRKRTKLDK